MARVILLLFGLIFVNATFADQVIKSINSATPPTIDGMIDKLWEGVPEIITQDKRANIDIHIKSVHSKSDIYFLVQFHDATENRQHKTLIWTPQLELYKVGIQREDTLIFKWNMELLPKKLTLTDETPYKADIWYWKSHRTDHAGYADDKFQIYNSISVPSAQSVVTKHGKIFYLSRRGDKGSAAYKSRLQTEYIGPEIPAFDLLEPKGSRADVRAKGNWLNGVWTIEFSRRLLTHEADDIQFKLDREYQFGVSRYEIAGRKPNPNIEQPLFGSGDITEHLYLRFEQ